MVKQKLDLEKVRRYVLKLLGDVGDQEGEEVASGAGHGPLAKADRVVYPIGAIRVWQGQRYIKTAKDRWDKYFDKPGEGKAYKQALAATIAQIKKAKDLKTLVKLIAANKQRFVREGGKMDPVIAQLLKYAKERRDVVAPKAKPEPKAAPAPAPAPKAPTPKPKEPTPEPPKKPEWAELDYNARFDKDRVKLVDEVVKARQRKIGGGYKELMDRYLRMNRDQLIGKAREYMGPEPAKVKLVVKVPSGAKPAAPKAKKGKGPDLGAKVHLIGWLKEDPQAFMNKFAEEYVAQHPGQGLNVDEVRRRWRRATQEDLGEAAKKLGIKRPEPKEDVKPEGWDKMLFRDKMKADRERFAKEIVAEQLKHGRRRLLAADRAARVQRYMNLNDDELAYRARNAFGEEAPEREARLKREAEAEARRKEAEAERRKQEEASAAKAEAAEKPEGWSKLDYTDRAKKNRQYFAEEIVRKRYKDWEGIDFNPKNVDHRRKLKDLLAGGDHHLVAKAEQILGKDQVKYAAEIAAQKAREQLLRDMVKADVHRTPTEKRLATGDVTGVKNLGGGVNTTKKITYKDADGNEHDAIFKSQAGEYAGDLRGGNIPVGEQWKRERLGFIVSDAVGLNIVPPVVIRDVKGEIGAAMDFVPGAEEWAYASAESQRKVTNESWQRLALQDWLTGNTDRHGKNWMVNAKGELFAIDNGLAFPEKGTFWAGGGYRSKPNRIVTDRIRNGEMDAQLPEAILSGMTDEAKARCVEAMKMYKIGGRGVELFEKRWDYIKKNKALPTYHGGDGMAATDRLRKEIDG